MNCYTFYPGDYLRDTQHLSMLEHGAYRLLLDFYYSTASPLPANAKQLHSIARVRNNKEKLAFDSVLCQFFVLQKDGKYHNGKADMLLVKYADIQEKRRDAALQMHSKHPCKKDANALSPNPNPKKEVKKEKKEVAIAPLIFNLPAWIPKETWDAFLDMRISLKHPATAHAQELIIKKLGAFKEKGQNPTKIIEKAIMNSWRDVYELKPGEDGYEDENAPRVARWDKEPD